MRYIDAMRGALLSICAFALSGCQFAVFPVVMATNPPRNVVVQKTSENEARVRALDYELAPGDRVHLSRQKCMYVRHPEIQPPECFDDYACDAIVVSTDGPHAATVRFSAEADVHRGDTVRPM